MRGALVIHAHAQHRLGIIPADAGSTEHGSLRYPRHKDHPRGCGEHLVTVLLIWPTVGSSPRMRGARHFLPLRLMFLRIIPADAGSTDGCH